MQEPEIILADEPTSSLDPKTRWRSWRLLSRFAAESRIPVIVNIHNVELARRFASRVVGMSGGAVVYDGSPQGLSEAASKADLRRRELDGMSDAVNPSARPKPVYRNWGARIGWCLLALYLVYACAQLGFFRRTIAAGIEHGQRFLAPHVPAEFHPLAVNRQRPSPKACRLP